MSSVQFEGVLEKSAAGIFKNKTKVWMVLRDACLEYYKENKRSSCIGSVDLCEIQTVRKLPDEEKSFKFEIISKSKTYIFAARSSEVAEAWVGAIHQGMMSLQEPTQTSTISSSLNSDGCEVQKNLTSNVCSSSFDAVIPARAAFQAEPNDMNISPEVTSVFGVKLKSRQTSRSSATSLSSDRSSSGPTNFNKESHTGAQQCANTNSKASSASPTSRLTENTKETEDKILINDVHDKRITFQRSSQHIINHLEDVRETEMSSVVEKQQQTGCEDLSKRNSSEPESIKEVDDAEDVFYEDDKPESDQQTEIEETITKENRQNIQKPVEEVYLVNKIDTCDPKNITSAEDESPSCKPEPVLARRESGHLYDDPENLDENTVVMRRSSRRGTTSSIRTTGRNTEGTVSTGNPLQYHRSKLIHQDSSFDQGPDENVKKDIEQIYETIFKDTETADTTERNGVDKYSRKQQGKETGKYNGDLNHVLSEEFDCPAYCELRQYLEVDLGLYIPVNTSINGEQMTHGNKMSDLREYLSTIM